MASCREMKGQREMKWKGMKWKEKVDLDCFQFVVTLQEIVSCHNNRLSINH